MLWDGANRLDNMGSGTKPIFGQNIKRPDAKK